MCKHTQGLLGKEASRIKNFTPYKFYHDILLLKRKKWNEGQRKQWKRRERESVTEIKNSCERGEEGGKERRREIKQRGASREENSVNGLIVDEISGTCLCFCWLLGRRKYEQWFIKFTTTQIHKIKWLHDHDRHISTRNAYFAGGKRESLDKRQKLPVISGVKRSKEDEITHKTLEKHFHRSLLLSTTILFSRSLSFNLSSSSSSSFLWHFVSLLQEFHN